MDDLFGFDELDVDPGLLGPSSSGDVPLSGLQSGVAPVGGLPWPTAARGAQRAQRAPLALHNGTPRQPGSPAAAKGGSQPCMGVARGGLMGPPAPRLAGAPQASHLPLAPQQPPLLISGSQPGVSQRQQQQPQQSQQQQQQPLGTQAALASSSGGEAGGAGPLTGASGAPPASSIAAQLRPGPFPRVRYTTLHACVAGGACASQRSCSRW